MGEDRVGDYFVNVWPDEPTCVKRTRTDPVVGHEFEVNGAIVNPLRSRS